jgi:hypothetical protein
MMMMKDGRILVARYLLLPRDNDKKEETPRSRIYRSV